MLKMSGKERVVRNAGIIGALVTGVALASLALLGISESLATSSLIIKILAGFAAFVVGAAIGGGLSVWISEFCQRKE